MGNLGVLIYWITRLDTINYFFIGSMVLGLCFTITVVSIFLYYFVVGKDSHNDNYQQIKKSTLKASIISVCITVFFSFCLIFTPTTQEACVIYLIPKITENKNVQEIPDKALQLLNSHLDKWINELK
jgi:aspartyl/asparaginyl beta-hydroxylase (cupin superfamily)